MSEPSVTASDVERIAELARIDLDEEAVESYRADFAEILGYFDRLDAVPDRDWDDPREDVLREDEVEESLPIEDVLANASETEDGHFKGPPVS